VCVCARACVCVRACVRACVCSNTSGPDRQVVVGGPMANVQPSSARTSDPQEWQALLSAFCAKQAHTLQAQVTAA
jgi:hypothetical protein